MNQLIKEKILIAIDFVKANQTIILASLLVFTSGMNIYFYRALSDLRENPQKAVQAETKRMIDKISELIILPTDEQPTIATVSDPEKLKDQPFFAKAQKGFKVLIYANAGKSILYDPFENKVVEIASMNTSSQTAPPPSQTPSLKNK